MWYNIQSETAKVTIETAAEVLSSSETAKVINSAEQKQIDAEQSSHTNFIGSDQHLRANFMFNTE